MKPGAPLLPATHDPAATALLLSGMGVHTTLSYGGSTPLLATQAAAKSWKSFTLTQVVVTNVTGSVVAPGAHAGDAAAAWLVGPTGWLQVVVTNVTGSVVGGPTTHDATGFVWLLAGGRVQMKMK